MKSILVTGSNRSGTSWMGKMLCLSGEAFLIWEPFNHLKPCPGYLPENPLKIHYQRILPGQERAMKRYIRYQTLLYLTYSTESGSGFPGMFLRGWKIALSLLKYSLGRFKPLFKDPIALMSAEWMAREYDAGVVIMVRHPCAYVNSVRRLGWRTPVEDFLRQDNLMADLPEDLQDEIRRRASERPAPKEGEFDLEDAALCWKVFHTVIQSYRTGHPDWLVVRHEDLCRDHVSAFSSVYEKLGLKWSERVAAAIDSYCGSSNEVVQGNSIHVFHQDSASLAEAWRSSLSSSEIEKVKRLTAPVWEDFYGEDSWN